MTSLSVFLSLLVYAFGNRPERERIQKRFGYVRPINSSYNKSKTPVPKNTTNSVKLFDDVDPQVTDIKQGNLGNCYFLAVLAALVNTQPQIIKDAFVSETLSQTKKAVYLIRLTVGGQVRSIAIDDMFPMAKASTPNTFDFSKESFKFSRAIDFQSSWPLFLEKAYAKLYGAYFAIDSGTPYEAFKALSVAPVDCHLMNKYSSDNLFEIVMKAVENEMPIVAGSQKGDLKYGVATSHSYALLNALDSAEEGKLIQLYNPWARDSYSGTCKVREECLGTGSFWMKLAEFKSTFYILYIAKIKPTYQLSSTPLSVGLLDRTLVTFSFNSASPFSLSLTWPSQRLFPKICEVSDAFEFMVFSQKHKDSVRSSTKALDHNLVSDVQVEFPGISGDTTYSVIFASPKEHETNNTSAFRKIFLDNVVLTVYHDGLNDVVFNVQPDYYPGNRDSLMLRYVFQRTSCDIISWGMGTWERSADRLGASPVWKSKEAPYEIFYIHEFELTYSNLNRKPKKLSLSDVKCSTKDGGGTDLGVITSPLKVHDKNGCNIHARGCLKRYENAGLNNFQYLAEGNEDNEFEPKRNSIVGSRNVCCMSNRSCSGHIAFKSLAQMYGAPSNIAPAQMCPHCLVASLQEGCLV